MYHSPLCPSRHHHYTNVTYDIKSPINCQTRNVIYKITCEKCPTFIYIGETERSFHDCFSEHRLDAINQDQKKPCGIHFSKPLSLNKFFIEINRSSAKKKSHSGSINTRQLNMEQTLDANCMLLFIIFSKKTHLFPPPLFQNNAN